MGGTYILQLTQNPGYALQSDWITAEDFFDTDLGGHADYYDDVDLDTRKEVIDDVIRMCALKRGTVKEENTGEKIRYMLLDKEGYAKRQFKWVRKALKDALAMTYEEYQKDPREMEVKIFNVKEAWDDKFGYYVSDDYGGWSTLDSYIRHCDPTKPLYFGGVVYYHS